MTDITYPFSKQPEFNVIQEISPRIYWLRLAMPFSLDHINLWLIEEDSDWTLIDTGPNTPSSKNSWLEIISSQLKNKPIGRVICTHAHPDHIGLVGRISKQQSAQLLMSKGEFEFYHQLFAKKVQAPFSQIEQFYQLGGAGDKEAQRYLKHIKIFSDLIYPVPSIYQQLKHEDCVTLGKYLWQVHVGTGHSPEHICLFCEKLNLFISGDQLLPTISSNVSVWPTRPDVNPMADFLSSCHYLNKTINNKTLVLPSHGLPFNGGNVRLNKLIEEMEKNINNLYDFCQQPRTVTDVLPILFKGKLNDSNLMFAYGEALASLNYLCAQGKVEVIQGTNNIHFYQKNNIQC
ncbi:MBL fold metallo-hydrolase [Colwellia sp. MSW7]|uniref:MBL fold metallo-hydrolase n=1 Tax=Colwellia maritima TaxID=2912588 RepID=A0ABS9WVX5_9GAMM|nr:MBL fold metallo-hydrolase [Colwellia maritima]MCI2282082.1 MBL fold metallo-hydrolase [Colwellia maritima]MCI2285877.1 MBL fold metallo-hydrolase [Colwellia maritima]